MSGVTNCSSGVPLPDFVKPPTNLAYFAVENLKNVEDALKSCCGDSPVSNYENKNDINLGSDCFAYCNITASGLTGKKVDDCLGEKLKDASLSEWKTKWVDQKSGAMGLKTGGWIGG